MPTERNNRIIYKNLHSSPVRIHSHILESHRPPHIAYYISGSQLNYQVQSSLVFSSIVLILLPATNPLRTRQISYPRQMDGQINRRTRSTPVGNDSNRATSRKIIHQHQIHRTVTCLLAVPNYPNPLSCILNGAQCIDGVLQQIYYQIRSDQPDESHVCHLVKIKLPYQYEYSKLKISQSKTIQYNKRTIPLT